MLIAGRVKASTDAVIGSEAVVSLQNYHFSRGFFGTNGIAVEEGFTTPDIEEARNKCEAMKRAISAMFWQILVNLMYYPMFLLVVWLMQSNYYC